MSNEDVILRPKTVYKSFGGLRVPAGVDPTSPKNGLRGPIGANGAAKVSFFKAMAGQQKREE